MISSLTHRGTETLFSSGALTGSGPPGKHTLQFPGGSGFLIDSETPVVSKYQRWELLGQRWLHSSMSRTHICTCYLVKGSWRPWWLQERLWFAENGVQAQSHASIVGRGPQRCAPTLCMTSLSLTLGTVAMASDGWNSSFSWFSSITSSLYH